MKVLFASHDPRALRLRSLAERRVRDATRRVGWLSPSARVQLNGLEAGRAGLDKRCRVELAGRYSVRVVVTALARDWPTALEIAIRRAARNLLLAARRADQARMPRRMATPA